MKNSFIPEWASIGLLCTSNLKGQQLIEVMADIDRQLIELQALTGQDDVQEKVHLYAPYPPGDRAFIQSLLIGQSTLDDHYHFLMTLLRLKTWFRGNTDWPKKELILGHQDLNGE